VSNQNYSYVDDSCLTLDSLETDVQHQAMFSLYGEKFENKVKLDWPPPIQENDQGLYILDYVADGTICFYQGLMIQKITIWNVTTKEFKVLPPSPLESPPPSYDSAMFSLHGFGYDLKVIRNASHCMPLTDFEIYISLPPHDSMWEVYNLRSNSWEKLDVDIPTGYYHSGNGIHTNGVCHWWDGFDVCMVSFDLTSDIFFTL
jgi:F-box interacting protein